MEQIITRNCLCSLSFLLILGPVSALAENGYGYGFHDDLETSLKAYFGEILSNETTATPGPGLGLAGSKTKVLEDDRWKRSPIYTAHFPSYVADKYNGDKKSRVRGQQSYGKPDGYKQAKPSNDKYAQKKPVITYEEKKKNTKKEPEYSPSAYKGSGMKTRPEISYGAKKKVRPVASDYGPSKRLKAKYVPSGKGKGKPAPYGPSNKGKKYSGRPTYNRKKKPPQKKGPHRPRPRKKHYPGQRCPYKGRCKKIQYRPGYKPSRPMPAYYKPKETEYGQQTPHAADAYEPSRYEEPTEMKPTYEPGPNYYEAGKPYEPKPELEYKPEYEAGEPYRQPEPAQYGTIEPYRDQEPYSSTPDPNPMNEYTYDEPAPGEMEASYDAQQESAPAQVDYGMEETYQGPQEGIAYGEPYPIASGVGGYEKAQEEGNLNPEYETSSPAQAAAGGPDEDHGANYGEEQEMYDRPVQLPEDYSEPAYGQYPSMTDEDSGNGEPEYEGLVQQQQQHYDGNPYSDNQQYEAGMEDYRPVPPPPRKQPQPAVYDLKNVKGNSRATGRTGYFPLLGYGGYTGTYGLQIGGSSDYSRSSDDSSQWRRQNRHSSGSSADSDFSEGDDMGTMSSGGSSSYDHRYRH